MAQPKTLRVIESMNPSYGGPCQGVRNSIPELKAMGAVSEVVSVDAPNSEWSAKDDFPIVCLGPGKGPWGYAPRLLPWLKGHLPDYDVVLVHGLWQYYGYAVRKAIDWLRARGKSTPRFFIMPHGMLDPYFQKAPERKLKALRNRIFWNLVERKTVNSADALLFTCQEELELARTTFRGYRPKNEVNVGYGILPPEKVAEQEITAFREQFAMAPDEEYLLYLSRIHPKKGLLDLVKAYSSFSEKNATLPKLVVAGPGMEEEYGKSIADLVENDPHLKGKVVFIGMITGTDKWSAFHGAKAFVLPSHQENFGIVVAEALACKCPVLISDKVNIWREIADGEAGFVDEDTPEGTYSLLKRFSDCTDGHLSSMGKNAHEVYLKHFTIGRAAENLLETFREKNG